MQLLQKFFFVMTEHICKRWLICVNIVLNTNDVTTKCASVKQKVKKTAATTFELMQVNVFIW